MLAGYGVLKQAHGNAFTGLMKAVLYCVHARAVPDALFRNEEKATLTNIMELYIVVFRREREVA